LNNSTRRLTRAGIIAALYVALTLLLGQFSFHVIQVRVAEALTLLPIIYPEAVPALFVGCLIANSFGGLGLVDIIGGSLVTLIAAIVTYRFRHSWVAYLSPILFNAFLVGAYLSYLFEFPYWLTILTVGTGQTIAVFALGYPLIRLLRHIDI